MKNSRFAIPALAATLILLGADPARAIRIEKMSYVRPNGVQAEIEVVSEEAVIQFSAETTPAERDAVLASIGARRIEEFPSAGWTHVGLAPGVPVSVGLTQLRGLSGVVRVQPNNVFRPSKIPNDPMFDSQYHLGKINAPAGWEYEVGDSSTVTVVVVDAGVEKTHPDLQSKLVGSAQFQFCDVNNSGTCGVDPGPLACNHGTMVAGVAAASTNNGFGVSGVSWRAKVFSIKVFPHSGCNPTSDPAPGDCPLTAGCVTNDTTMWKALNYARLNLHNKPQFGKVVVNMSIGGAATCGWQDAFIQTEINNAVGDGMVIVVSAGNDGGAVNSPGNCSNVIPVGATDKYDNIASFSSRGTELASNGVVAPGVSLVTTDVGGGYTAGATGTSFSAPIVSGLAALILAEKPAYTPAQVQAAIRNSADGIGVSSLGLAAGSRPSGNVSGAGRVNAFRAMKLVVEGTLAGFAGDEKVIAFPNPFRTGTHRTATISIPRGLQSTSASIRIYTIDGQMVRDLGAQTTWDGANDSGLPVATGVYIILVTTDAGSERARVAVIR
ncbi:MAG: S8 family peptidase [Elusimicrobiota bacterium]